MAESTQAAAKGDAAAKSVLDPVERSAEVLFGLIMVLSFTLTIGLAEKGREEMKPILIGALGCNLAWGIVDAIMYLLNVLGARGRELKVAHAVRGATTPERARAVIEDALPEPLAHSLKPADLDAIAARVRALPSVADRPPLRGDDLRAAGLVFLLVFVSTLPVVVPFVVIRDDVKLARHVSNGVALVMLYFAGHSVGRYSFKRPWAVGVAMVVVGLLLVGVTMALGG